MRIENWSIMMSSPEPYNAPEQQVAMLQGLVYDHPRFHDGDPITTSAIVGIEDGKVRTRSGSLYELGEVDPYYEAAYPGARARVMGGQQ